MSRETKKFKTTGGHEIEIYSYLTGQEMREIEGVFIDGIESVNDKSQEQDKSRSSLIYKGEDMTIEKIVVSLDGNNENILKRILDLPSADFKDIVSEINSVTKIAQKKNS